MTVREYRPAFFDDGRTEDLRTAEIDKAEDALKVSWIVNPYGDYRRTGLTILDNDFIMNDGYVVAIISPSVGGALPASKRKLKGNGPHN